jgi:hypothetical protein
MSGNVYVAPHGSAWEVKLQGSDHFESIHRNRDSAFCAARSTARKEQTTVVICTEDVWGGSGETGNMIEAEGRFVSPSYDEDDDWEIEPEDTSPVQEIMPIVILQGKRALMF